MRTTGAALVHAICATGASAKYIDLIEMIRAPPGGAGIGIDTGPDIRRQPVGK